jgi:carbon storage regulator
MLILSRKVGESLIIGDDVTVTVVALNGNQIRLGISAPRHVRVLRQEILQAMQEENRAAANTAQPSRRLDDVVRKWHRKTDDDAGD